MVTLYGKELEHLLALEMLFSFNLFYGQMYNKRSGICTNNFKNRYQPDFFVTM